MANMLIESLAGDYDPAEYEDDYAQAVEALVTAKLEGGEVRQAPESKDETGEVVDLLAALAKSVEKAKASRGETTAPAEEKPAKKAAAKTAAKKTAAKTTAPAKKTAAKKTAAKRTAKKASHGQHGARRGRATRHTRVVRRGAQAFSRRKVAVPHQIARANSAVAHSEPHTIGEVAKSPANEVHTASTTQRKGIESLAASSQSGPIVMGSRIPRAASTGITMLMTGAMTSSLLVVRPQARGRGAGAADEQREEYAEGDPAADASMPMAKPRPTRMRAWTNSLQDVADEPPDEQRRATGRGDPLGLDDALAPLADETKPAKKAPKMPAWTSMPGTKNVQALVAPNWLISGLSRGPNSSR